VKSLESRCPLGGGLFIFETSGLWKMWEGVIYGWDDEEEFCLS